ncbi:EamA family transporter [Winogradskya consettensis]|uniref:EamA domain-containing protein n=1 Tax=Winogradskya consettensis TaxID=113560 RepID=A0A919VQW3_9ACTN|nr:EamA family transporter [Actinoplanes consettensis]GIM73001.1 hypothetical protein Aco04nite_33130 [Actinoplanes consettensis]
MDGAMAAAGAAGLAWGGSDFLAGVCARRLPVRAVLVGAKVAGMVIALLYLADRSQALPGGARVLVGAAVAGMIGIPAMGLLYRAMRDHSLTVVAPVAASAALVPLGWGLTHGEHFGLPEATGTVAALAAVVLTSRPGESQTGRTAGLRSSLAAVGAALGFGTYFVLLHEAAPDDPYAATAYARITGGVVALLLVMCRPAWSGALRGRPGSPSTSWFLLPAAVGALDTIGDATFAVSAAAGALGAAAMLASMYPAVTVLLNVGVLGEPLPRVHLAGVLSALVALACFAA